MSTTNFTSFVFVKLHDLEILLRDILKEDRLIHSYFLVRQGFILRKYVIKHKHNFNSIIINKLINECIIVSEIENDIKKFFNDNISEIKELETSFHAYTGLKLHFERIILEYMNNTFTLTNLLIVQFQSIDKAIQKNEANKVAHLLSSIERMSNQILRFIDLLNQLNQKVDKFENESYYPSEKTYGRIMSSKEFRNMKSTGLLSSDKNPTPVFDATPAVIDRIDSMSTDRRSTYFQEIGVRSTDNIVYFRTKLKPVVGPVPQSNGLREYKFPKGIPVEFLKAA